MAIAGANLEPAGDVNIQRRHFLRNPSRSSNHELVAEGLTNQSIARRLSVAPRTAEAHVENIRRKLEVHSRAQIAAWVTEQRLRS